MKNLKLIMVLLIGVLTLAACSGAQDTQSVSETSEMADDAMADDAMADDAMADDAMADDAMADDAMADDAMADDAMADDAMADDDSMMAEEGHDDDMDEEGHDDDMDDDDHAMDDDEMAKETMSEDGADAMMAEDAMGDMAELPAWQQLSLTDARTGETFTLADFSGKTVFVEPMATWCTNCRRQLGNVRDARAQLNDEDVVFIGLSLETNISDAELAQYQSDQGYDWTFAVMSPEILQQLADAFGRSITSAPSTPHFVIRPDGSTTELVTGIESADQILQQIQAARG